MDYGIYKIIHITGLVMTFMALAGMAMHAMNGGTKDAPARKIGSMTHGMGLLLALLGGFGMLARLHIAFPWPGWVFAKVALWIALGGLLVAARKPGAAGKVWWLLIGIVAAAAYLAVYKPF